MTLNKILKQLKSSESTVSMVLGVVVVVVVGIILFNYFRNYSTSSQTSGTKETAPGGSESGKATGSLPAKYKIVKGDTLWSISEKFFQSGYNWTDIVKQNNISNPNIITEGQELTIPNVPARQATVTQPAAPKTADPKAITGGQYTVVKGDSLWDISVRAYQDGFKWVEIAKANKLADPNTIHPGNTLTIPR